MSLMDEQIGIMVTRPIYNQFQTLLVQTQSNADDLMNHFFELHKKNKRKNVSTSQNPLSKGSNFSKLTVNIPKDVLRRDISVNVALPDGCQSSDDGENPGESPREGMAVQIDGDAASPYEPSATPKGLSSRKREQVLKCNNCSFKTNGKRKFQNHLQNHSRRHYKCLRCNMVFIDDSKLKRHVRIKHEKNRLNLVEGSTVNSSTVAKNRIDHCTLKDQNTNDREFNSVDGQEIMAARDNTCASHFTPSRFISILGGRTLNSLISKRKKYFKYKCACRRHFCSKSRLLHHKKFCKYSNYGYESKMNGTNWKLRQMLLAGKISLQRSNQKIKRIDRIFNVLGKSHDFNIGGNLETFRHDKIDGHTEKEIQQTDARSSMESPELNEAYNEDIRLNGHARTCDQNTSSHRTNDEYDTGENDETELMSEAQVHDDEVEFTSVNQCQNEADLLLSFSRSINQPSSNLLNDDIQNFQNRHSQLFAVRKFGERNGELGNEVDTAVHESTLSHEIQDDKSKGSAYKPNQGREEFHSKDLETLSVESNQLNIKQENIEIEALTGNQNNAVQMTEEEQFFMNFAQEVSRRYVEENQNFANFYMGRNAPSFHEESEGILKCEECGEIFKRKAYLKEHIEGKHGGGLRYSCDCGKKFKWRSSLGNHRKNCPVALTAPCSNEGQNAGQNVSVIDFSQYNPYLGIENNWANEIERLKHSVLFAKKSSEMNSTVDKHASNFSQDEKRAVNDPKIPEQKTNDQPKQEFLASQNSLRIDTTLVKPFADALSKYKQKQPTPSCQKTNSKGTIETSTDVIENDKAIIDLTTDHKNKSSVVNTLSGEKMQSRIRNEEITHDSLGHGRKSSTSGTDQLKGEEQCSFCNESFCNKSELERHKLFCKHLQDTCSVCGQRFQHRKELVNHLLTFHGNDESYNCFCGFQSSTWALFEKHCEKCDEFKTKSVSLLSTDKSLSQFRNQSSTESGLTGIHNKPRIRRHSDMSDMRLSSNNDLSTNMALLHHGLNTACSELSPNFQPRYSTQQAVSPISQDNGEQSIALPTFSSFVSSSANLLKNSKLLTSSTASTNQNSQLSTGGFDTAKVQDSSRAVENDTVSKKGVYVCSFCGNVFNDLQKFSEHNKLHLRKKLPENNQSHLLKSAVDMAINKSRQHSVRVTEHVCHLCGDVFAAKAYLKEHIGGKHGTIDRYKCPCGMRFKWRSSLGIHQRKCPKACRRTYNRWNSS